MDSVRPLHFVSDVDLLRVPTSSREPPGRFSSNHFTPLLRFPCALYSCCAGTRSSCSPRLWCPSSSASCSENHGMRGSGTQASKQANIHGTFQFLSVPMPCHMPPTPKTTPINSMQTPDLRLSGPWRPRVHRMSCLR
ncbi:hypothetical protein BKA80DRAFT_281375 [Phyllosticta citrichinensis]